MSAKNKCAGTVETCHNTVGSFTCDCLAEYTGKLGFICAYLLVQQAVVQVNSSDASGVWYCTFSQLFKEYQIKFSIAMSPESSW